MSNHIYTAQQNRIGVIWVEGAGTHENVQSFRDALTVLNESDLKEIIFEFVGCYHLDSTFMGVIAKENRIHKEAGFDAYIISRVPIPVLKEMQTLGLNHLLQIEDRALTPDWTALRKEVISKSSKADRTVIMHDAHKALAEMSELNRSRFQDVIQQLAKKIGL